MSRPFSINTTRTTYNQDGTWSGPQLQPIYHPKLSLGQLIVNKLSSAPFNVGQLCHDDGHEMQNHEILRNSVRVCLHLKDLGLKEGEIIGLACGNSRYVSQVVIGAFLSGNPINSLDPSFDFTNVLQNFAMTRPKLVFCDRSNYDDVKQALKELNNASKIIICDAWDEKHDDSVMDFLVPHAEEHLFVPPTLKDIHTTPAMIIYSSGSTGAPKAIPLSHQNLITMFQDPIPVPAGASTFSFCSFNGMSGIANLLTSVIHGIKRIIVQKPFSAALMWEIVRERRVSLLTTSPIHVQMLLQDNNNKSDIDSLLAITCVGANIPDGLQSRTKVPLINFYGQTESGKIALNGQLYDGVTVKIVNRIGELLGAGECGEVCVKPSLPFLGYYGNREATDKIVKEDGFMYTGDLGMFDEGGNLQVVERMSEILRYGNNFINPTDVENVLQKIEGIGPLAVVGVPHSTMGDLPAVLIIQKEESTLTAKDVHDFAKSNFPDHKLLRGGVYFVKGFPMTPTGKVKRKLAAKLAEELFARNVDMLI